MRSLMGTSFRNDRYNKTPDKLAILDINWTFPKKSGLKPILNKEYIYYYINLEKFSKKSEPSSLTEK